jgi:AraC-like DNA-binding protein
MRKETPSRLERSCATPAGDWMRSAPSAPGFERAEAYFSGRGFAPHRHDTYAMGVTLSGVQAFRYRGALQRSTADQAFVLHPDEVHDGHAGTASGFGYRIVYIEPRLIQAALDAPWRPLPFVRQAVTNDRRLAAAIAPALDDLATPLDDLRVDGIVQAIADALAALDGSVPGRALVLDSHAVGRARDYLDAHADGPVASGELETVCGLSRYALARHFRAGLGTSPHRYLIMRRLERASRLIAAGETLASAAGASGFADQSHMTRHFKQAYGLTPGRWARMIGLGRRHSPAPMSSRHGQDL